MSLKFKLMIFPKVQMVENGHHFWRWKNRYTGEENRYLTCRDCGNVRRADGKNSQCKGKIEIKLRGGFYGRVEEK